MWRWTGKQNVCGWVCVSILICGMRERCRHAWTTYTWIHQSFTCEIDAIDALFTMAGAGSGLKSSSSSVVSAHRSSLMIWIWWHVRNNSTNINYGALSEHSTSHKCLQTQTEHKKRRSTTLALFRVASERAKIQFGIRCRCLSRSYVLKMDGRKGKRRISLVESKCNSIVVDYLYRARGKSMPVSPFRAIQSIFCFGETNWRSAFVPTPFGCVSMSSPGVSVTVQYILLLWELRVFRKILEVVSYYLLQVPVEITNQLWTRGTVPYQVLQYR